MFQTEALVCEVSETPLLSSVFRDSKQLQDADQLEHHQGDQVGYTDMCIRL